MKNLLIMFTLLLSMSVFAEGDALGVDEAGDADASLCAAAADAKGEVVKPAKVETTGTESTEVVVD